MRILGYWLDVDLSGEPPQPRHSAAMVTVDEHRGLLHGGSGSKRFDDAFVLNLREKVFILLLHYAITNFFLVLDWHRFFSKTFCSGFSQIMSIGEKRSRRKECLCHDRR